MWSGSYDATLCCGCISCVVAPLNALGSDLSIWVKSIKPSEGLLHKKRQPLRFPLVEENLKVVLSDFQIFYVTISCHVANLANTKWCKKTGKWLKSWYMGTHLRVLGKSYPMPWTKEASALEGLNYLANTSWRLTQCTLSNFDCVQSWHLVNL